MEKKLKSKKMRIWIALAMMPAIPSIAFALSFARVPAFEEIVGMSSIAFHGVVENVEYSHVTDRERNRPIPYTTVSYRVLSPIKNALSGELVIVRQAGGRLPNGHWGTLVGVGHRRIGDEVVLFANPSRQPFFGSLYAGNGIFRVVEESGRKLVLSQTNRPLMGNKQRTGFAAASGAQCVLDDDIRNVCRKWDFAEAYGGNGIQVHELLKGKATRYDAAGDSLISLPEFLAYAVETAASAADREDPDAKEQIPPQSLREFEKAYLKYMTASLQ